MQAPTNATAQLADSALSRQLKLRNYADNPTAHQF